MTKQKTNPAASDPYHGSAPARELETDCARSRQAQQIRCHKSGSGKREICPAAAGPHGRAECYRPPLPLSAQVPALSETKSRPTPGRGEIGRASCRERVCQSV